MKGLYTILMLVGANVFMTFAWYGHLKLKDVKGFESTPLMMIIFLSWGVALFEYFLQIPANRIGYLDNGGPFSLIQLKIIQEVLSLTVFMVFMLIFFKNEPLRWNHMASFGCIVLAVYFAFLKR